MHANARAYNWWHLYFLGLLWRHLSSITSSVPPPSAAAAEAFAYAVYSIGGALHTSWFWQCP